MIDRRKILDVVLIILRHKKKIIVNFFIICVIALIVALTADKKYQSTLTFLPPAQQGVGIAGIMSDLPTGLVERNDITTQQLMSILHSRALREKVIRHFNLIEHYELSDEKNKMVLTLKNLQKDLLVHAERDLSLQGTRAFSISLQALHASPDTAYLMARYSFDMLDSTVNAVNSLNARRTREFLEERILSANQELDSIQAEFEEFQLANQFYSIDEQVRIVINSISEIKSQIVAGEIQREVLLNSLSPSNPSVKKLDNELGVLRDKLKSIQNKQDPDILIGLERVPSLSAEYAEYLLRINVKSKVILFLSQKLEQERVLEKRKISYLSIIDPPVIAEYKYKPKRAFIVLGIVMFENTLFILLLLLGSFYKRHLRSSDGFNRIKKALTNW